MPSNKQSHLKSSNLLNKSNNNKDDSIRKNVSFQRTNSPSLNIDKNIPERYTPNTEFDDYPPELFQDSTLIPDLSFLCNICKLHINLNEIKHHQEFHNSLTFFGFNQLPENEKELNEKRKSLIKNTSKNLKKLEDFETNKANEWNNRIKQINENYELLKSHLNDTFESNRLLKEYYKNEAQGESRIASNDKIVSIGSCSIQNKAHKSSMEDANIILDTFGENNNFVYIGTFDGYDGDVASTKCTVQFHLALLHNLSKADKLDIKFEKEKYIFDEINHLEKYNDNGLYENMHKNQSIQTKSKFDFNDYVDKKDLIETSLTEEDKTISNYFRDSFKYAYRQMDKLLSRGKDETSKVRWSGATACTCIIEKRDSSGWIHLSNCGDVEAIVVLDSPRTSKNFKRNYKILTHLHTLNECIKDRDTIERNGCKIFETSAGQKKIFGLYPITRGLGFHGDKNVKPFISSKPTVRSYKIEDNFICLIIATKGLWNALSHEKVADIVLQTIPSNRIQYLNERPVSPSVKSILHQYIYNKQKEQFKIKKNLLTSVEDENEEIEEDDEYETNKDNLNIKNEEQKENNSKLDSEIESNYEYYKKSKAASEPYQSVEEIKNIPNLIKSSSDVYPLVRKSEQYFKLDSNELQRLEKNRPKPIESSSLKSNDRDLKLNKKNDESDIKSVKKDSKIVQVSAYEINKTSRDLMENRILAKRLEVSEMLCEALVSSAIIAGSTDNITVNCILLPGCNL